MLNTPIVKDSLSNSLRNPKHLNTLSFSRIISLSSAYPVSTFSCAVDGICIGISRRERTSLYVREVLKHGHQDFDRDQYRRRHRSKDSGTGAFIDDRSHLGRESQHVQYNDRNGRQARSSSTAKAARRPPLTGTPAERWIQFLSKAPDRTRDFAQLIEAGYPNFVTQADAMEALGITQARAIGGLTGSMRRWAVADKLELPWASTKQNGERVWIWCGFDESGELRSPPAIFSEVEKENAPPANYDEYFERLSDRSQNFLRYLEREGKASIAQTMAALNITSSKALGGLAGSLNRWGRAAGVPVPFITEVDGDEKYFRWVGIGGESSNPKLTRPRA